MRHSSSIDCPICSGTGRKSIQSITVVNEREHNQTPLITWCIPCYGEGKVSKRLAFHLERRPVMRVAS